MTATWLIARSMIYMLHLISVRGRPVAHMPTSTSSRCSLGGLGVSLHKRPVASGDWRQAEDQAQGTGPGDKGGHTATQHKAQSSRNTQRKQQTEDDMQHSGGSMKISQKAKSLFNARSTRALLLAR